MFAKAGSCEACLADDLLFARDLDSGRIFLVCAACGSAGVENSDTSLTDIRKAHQYLAPSGWTLASPEEVEAAGFGSMVVGDAPDGYVNLISWYPGLRVLA